MSLHNKNNQGQSNQTQTDTQQDYRTQDNTVYGGEQPTRAARMSITNIDQVLGRRMGRNSNSENLTRLVRAMQEVLELRDDGQEPLAENYRLLPMDYQQYQLPLSCLNIITVIPTGGGEVAVVFTLMLENEHPLQDRGVQSPGVRGEVRIPTYADDVYGDEFRECVTKMIKNQHGENIGISFAGMNVLPYDFDTTDQNRLRHVIYNSVAAIETICGLYPEYEAPAFNLARFTDSTDLFIARMEFNPSRLTDSKGNPIRSDVRISMTAQKKNSQRDIMSSGSVLALTQVDGFVDLTYVDPSENQPVYPYQPDARLMNRIYQPRFVMTLAQPVTNAITSELLMLALSNAFLMAENNQWWQIFRPAGAPGDMDFRDIGACGYEVDFAGTGQTGYIDTHSVNFNLAQTMHAIMYPELVFSIDIERGGDLTWVQTFLANAAMGDLDCLDEVVRVCDNLTDNHFSSFIDPNQPLLIDEVCPIHLGWYKDAEGNKRDIRDIDYLAVLNAMGGRDIDAVQEWGNTFDQAEVNQYQRLQAREQIIRRVTNDNCVITGMADRFTLHPNLVTALGLAIRKTGMNVRADQVYNEFGNQKRGNGNVRSYGVAQAPGTGMYQQRGGNVDNGRGMGARPMHYFGRR